VPLNKTRAHVQSAHVQQRAASVTNNRAALALELVGYDEDVKARK
jgi:hypothetical protein